MTTPVSTPTAGLLEGKLASSVRPTKWQAWILAARMKTLPAAAVPVAVGTACAWVMHQMHIAVALCALFGALAIQIATNFANDVFDAEKGADDSDRQGPARAVASGWITPSQMKIAMILAFAAATIAGSYLVYVAGWPVVAIGVASVISGIAYTGGPYPLGYNGLGDVFVFVFFGPVAVLGTVYVQTHSVPSLAVWASLPVGFLAAAILVVNNLRDADTDRRVGKRTIAVRFGKGWTLAFYGVLLTASGAVSVVMAGLYRSGWLLLPLAFAPVAAKRFSQLRSAKKGAVFNRLLANTAQLLLLYGVLLCTALVLASRS
jgi:1,4-dihydroxy-2-naphthoate polyprenyltransferase